MARRRNYVRDKEGQFAKVPGGPARIPKASPPQMNSAQIRIKLGELNQQKIGLFRQGKVQSAAQVGRQMDDLQAELKKIETSASTTGRKSTRNVSVAEYRASLARKGTAKPKAVTGKKIRK